MKRHLYVRKQYIHCRSDLRSSLYLSEREWKWTSLVLKLTYSLGISIFIDVRTNETTHIQSSWIILWLMWELSLFGQIKGYKIERMASNNKRHQSCSSILGCWQICLSHECANRGEAVIVTTYELCCYLKPYSISETHLLLKKEVTCC